MIKSQVTANEALNCLIKGNAEYEAANRNAGEIGLEKRKDLAINGQHPFAIVITCSDSRTPPEHIFNTGLGELFVIRNAGNLVGDYERGSVEYAAGHLGIPLVVIMGHDNCGAVNGALESESAEGYLNYLIEEINRSVKIAREKGLSGKELVSAVEDLNISNSEQRLMESPVISELVKNGKLMIVKVKYSLETGKVTLFNK